jgi:hypothetical protein
MYARASGGVIGVLAGLATTLPVVSVYWVNGSFAVAVASILGRGMVLVVGSNSTELKLVAGEPVDPNGLDESEHPITSRNEKNNRNFIIRGYMAIPL